jgi:hypothetical protein
MFEVLSSVEYKDKALHDRVKQSADKLFKKDSYVKNLWILKEYKKRGGEVSYQGKKPKNSSIKKVVQSEKESYNGRKQDYLFKVRFENYELASDKKKKVHLNKPFRTPGGPKKFAVYVKNDKGNIVLVRFGDPNMEIKRDDPKRRKSFRARHHCDNPGPKWKAQYWACQTWRADKSVKEVAGEEEINWFMVPTQQELFGNELPPFDIEEIDDCCWSCE